MEKLQGAGPEIESWCAGRFSGCFGRGSLLQTIQLAVVPTFDSENQVLGEQRRAHHRDKARGRDIQMEIVRVGMRGESCHWQMGTEDNPGQNPRQRTVLSMVGGETQGLESASGFEIQEQP